MSHKTPRSMTAKESCWVRQLRAVLGDCPDGLSLMTHGDHCVYVIDRALEAGDLHDGRAEERGAVLATVASRCRIHGVSA